MTIAARRRSYWVLFSVSLASLALALFLLSTVPGDADARDMLAGAGAYSVRSLLGLQVSSIALACAEAALAAAFAAGALAVILSRFRTTVSAEVFFFGAWAMSFAVESLRPLLLRMAVSGAPVETQLLAAKALLWAHYAGSLDLFAAGLYAAGLRNERHLGVAALLSAAALGLVSLIPVNTGVWLPSLAMQAGYGSLHLGFRMTIAVLTVGNFLVAARVRSDRAFVWGALALAMCMAGAWTMEAPLGPLWVPVSLALFGFGAWLFIVKMHKYYLWQ